MFRKHVTRVKWGTHGFNVETTYDENKQLTHGKQTQCFKSNDNALDSGMRSVYLNDVNVFSMLFSPSFREKGSQPTQSYY